MVRFAARARGSLELSLLIAFHARQRSNTECRFARRAAVRSRLLFLDRGGGTHGGLRRAGVRFEPRARETIESLPRAISGTSTSAGAWAPLAGFPVAGILHEPGPDLRG